MTEVFTVDLSRNPLPPILRKAATLLLNRLLGFDEFNALYAQLPPHAAEYLSRSFLDALRVNIEVVGRPLDEIPASGPLVVIANHPSGLIDGMVLDALLRSVRADVSVMAIYLLASIAEYRNRWIFMGLPRSKQA